MADVHSPDKRSKNMRAIRHKDTIPEIQVRRLLFAQGFRYRLHVKSLPGTPDIVLPKYRVAIFVHGCFWHGHNCYLFKKPQTRADFWLGKINSNRQRDERHERSLIDDGWRVVSIWECAIKGRLRQDKAALADDLAAWIRAGGVAGQRAEVRHLPANAGAVLGPAFANDLERTVERSITPRRATE